MQQQGPSGGQGGYSKPQQQQPSASNSNNTDPGFDSFDDDIPF
jgi:single-stranded DNA-binding protein